MDERVENNKIWDEDHGMPGEIKAKVIQ